MDPRVKPGGDSAVCARSWRPVEGLRGKTDGNFKPDTNVILFDDVTAKDGSVMQAVRARGATVKKIITLADRLERR